MDELPFVKIEFPTSKTLAIDFNSDTIKCFIIINERIRKTKGNEPISIANNLYSISKKKAEVMEAETRNVLSLNNGIFTRVEVENNQLLFQAELINPDINNAQHIEKAYQNFMEQLSILVPSYFSLIENKISYEDWLILLALPYNQDENIHFEMQKVHLLVLKSIGFEHVALLDHITASFYSQRTHTDLISPQGILINVENNTQVGVIDKKLITQSFIDIDLGFSQIYDYSKAILSDLSIHGFKQEKLGQWIQENGACDGTAIKTVKTIRRKEVDITPILNSPGLLFDYKAVTGKAHHVNSIIDGIYHAIKNSSKASRKNKEQFLKTIIITGQGAFLKGLASNITNQLQKIYRNNEMNVLIGNNPKNSVINGLAEFIKISPVLDSFNIYEAKTDSKSLKELENRYKKELQLIYSQLKMVKSKECISYLTKLRSTLGQVSVKTQVLPKPLHGIIQGVIINNTNKIWTESFKKLLRPYKKQTEKNLTECEAVIEILQQIALQIAQLPKNIQAPFTQVFTAFATEIKTVKTSHRDKLREINLKILLKSAKQFKGQDLFSMEELATLSNITPATILTLIPKFLDTFQGYGYLDGRILQFQERYLERAGKFLNLLRDELFNSLENNSLDKINDIVDQANEYCDFLIRGYNFIRQPNIAERFVFEKSEFLKEKR